MGIKEIIKTALVVILLVLLSYTIYDNFYYITNKIEYIYAKYFTNNIKQVLIDNEYKKNTNYEYLKINNDITLKNKEDIKNAIYTFLDAGWDKYIIKCDVDYLNCVNDVKQIVSNNTQMTNISNFVHPFNSFEKIDTSFNSFGKITLSKQKRYSNEEINILNQKVNEIYKDNYDPSKNIKENIKIFHDYIISNTKYDSSEINNSNNQTSKAYGVLINGLGVCSGYTDTMQLFLEKLNVKNYRISSDTHEWNLVFVEGNWLHLDLTWDDPIMSDNSDVLKHDYFLINNETLKQNDDEEHIFDEFVYSEGK